MLNERSILFKFLDVLVFFWYGYCAWIWRLQHRVRHLLESSINNDDDGDNSNNNNNDDNNNSNSNNNNNNNKVNLSVSFGTLLAVTEVRVK